MPDNMNCLTATIFLLGCVSITFAGKNISCDFEDYTCGWQIEHDEDGPWKRTKHTEEADLYYPDSSEYFMNLQCQTRIGRCRGRMASSDVFWNTSTSHVRISFWFLIQSPSNLSPSSLSLGFQETNRSVHWVFHSHQAFSDCFGHWTFVTLCTVAVQEDMQLIFEASAERYDNIGVDDFTSELVEECEDTVPNILCVTKPTPTTPIHSEKFAESVVGQTPRRRHSSSAMSATGNKMASSYELTIIHSLLILASLLRS